MGMIVTLILIGIILLFAEILIIPGVGIAGILGLLSLGGSSFYAFHEFDDLTGGIVTGVNVVLVIVLSIWVLRAKTWKRVSLETTIDAKANDDGSSVVAVGDKGVTVTRLAPMGTALFGQASAQVKAMEGMIDAGCEVEIVMIEDNRIYVSLVSPDFDEI